MAAHRKYQVRYDTAVSLEKSEYDLTRTLGILLPDALRIGINVMIQTMISQKDEKMNKQVLEEFIEIQKRDVEDLRAYIRIQDAAQQRLEDLAALQKDEKVESELIEVYDTDEEKKVQMTRKMAKRLGLV
jgi:hypothetical protein